MNVKNKLLAALLCASLTLGLLAVPAAAMADEIPAETVVETTVPSQEAPADEATEAPAVEETEAPTATEAPAVEETEAPAATEAPAVEETEAPAATEAPAVEETEAPEAALMDLSAEGPEALESDLPIEWSRTAESDALIEGPFDYSGSNTSHVPSSDALVRVYGDGELSDLVADSDETPVWEAHTDAAYYSAYTNKSAVKNPGATWYSHSGVSLRRIQGTFTVPSDCSVLDSTIRLASASQPSYEADSKLGTVNGGKVVAVNDNVYVFVYKLGEDINEENYMDFFAFYGGHNLPDQFGGQNNAMGERRPAYQKLMAISDSWFIHSQIDNLGAPLARVYGPNAMAGETYVIDMFLEDNSKNSGGGMDEVVLQFDQADPKTAPVFVEYYRASVSDESLLGREVYKGQTIGRSWDESKVDLDLYRGQAGTGYKAGQVVSPMPMTISADTSKNVIRVVYPEPDVVELTVEHVYSVGYAYGSDLGGKPQETILSTHTFAAPNTMITVDMLPDGPNELTYAFVALRGDAQADEEAGTVSIQLTDAKEQAIRIYYFHTLSIPYAVEHNYYTSVDGGSYELDASVAGQGGELYLDGTVALADLAQTVYEDEDYTLDQDAPETFAMTAELVLAYHDDDTQVPVIRLDYHRQVWHATVSIFHYYENDGGYVADQINGTADAIFDADSQTVTHDWVAGFVRGADQTPGGRYVYTSYEVMVMPQGAQAWNEPIYQLDGALDLNGVKDVRIHLVYDPYYTVTTTADGNSQITGTQSYKNGANAAVTYAAVEGWHIASVTVDGVAWTADQIAQAGGAIQFPAIKADHTVAVTTEADPVAPPTPEQHTVTAVIDGNGTITGAGTYEKGTDVTVTYAANTGYHIATVTVDGETWTQAQIDGAKGTISFPALDADHAVAVTTARDQSSNGNNGGDDDRDDRPSKPDKKPDPKPEVTPEITIPDVQPPQGDVPGGETVEIVDEQVPQGGAPEGEELVIEDQDTPLADVPDLTETTGGLVILDSDTPMGSLPQTGTLAAPVDNTRTLAAIALSASLCAAGLAVLLGRKKEDAE